MMESLGLILTRRAVQIGLLVALAILPHLASLQGGFIQDDESIVLNNPSVNGEASPLRAFTTSHWSHVGNTNGGAWRPLPVLGLALQYRLFGEFGPAYHLVNLLLHALATLALWWMLCALALPVFVPLIASALFAVHPIHGEVLCLIVGQLEILATLGILLCVALHARDYQIGKMPRGVGVALGIAAAGLAVFSKENAVCLPGLLILVDLTRKSPRLSRLRVGMWGAAFAVVVLMVVLRGVVLGYMFSPEFRPDSFIANPLIGMPYLDRLGLALRVLGYEIGLMVFPHHLLTDYGYLTFDLESPWSQPWLPMALLAVVGLAIFAIASWRKAPAWTFGVGWFAIAIFPVSNLVILTGVTMAERTLYTPSIGACIAVAALLVWLIKSPKLLTAVAAILCIMLTARSVVRVRDFHTITALYERAVEDNPQSFFSQMTLAFDAEERGDRQEARWRYREAFRIYQESPLLLIRWGLFNRDEGNLIEAMIAFRRATEINDSSLGAWINRANTANDLGLYAEGLEAAEHAFELGPDDPVNLVLLGDSLRLNNQWQRALEAYQRCVEIDPNVSLFWHQVGQTLIGLERNEEAIEALERASEIEPDSTQIQITLRRAQLRLEHQRSTENL